MSLTYAKFVAKKLAKNFTSGITFGLTGPHAFVSFDPLHLLKDVYELIRPPKKE